MKKIKKFLPRILSISTLVLGVAIAAFSTILPTFTSILGVIVALIAIPLWVIANAQDKEREQVTQGILDAQVQLFKDSLTPVELASYENKKSTIQ